MRGTYLDSTKFCYNLFTAKKKKVNLIATQVTEKGKQEPDCNQELVNKITKEEPNDD